MCETLAEIDNIYYQEVKSLCAEVTKKCKNIVTLFSLYHEHKKYHVKFNFMADPTYELHITISINQFLKIDGCLFHNSKNITNKTNTFVIEDTSDLIAHIKNINKSLTFGNSKSNN